MSKKKLFTLIYGDSIHAAPRAKVVPADSFSKLVDAEEVLQRIKDDAEKYRKEVVAESEILKEQAQKEGFEAGMAKWADHIVKLEREIALVRKEVEKVLIPAALKAAKKILGREIELSDSATVDIVANVLKSVSQHKKITIYVNKSDLEKLEKNKNTLRQVFENLESLSIRARDDVNPAGCIIETEAGIINAQLDHQWKALERAFESLMKSKKTE